LTVSLKKSSTTSPSIENNLIVSLQRYGIKAPHFIKRRKGGAGPAEGITIIIKNRPINVPTGGEFVSQSPYSIQAINEVFYLFENGTPLIKIQLPEPPGYYSLKTVDDIPYNKIALLHGTNCLASTVFQNCIYWNTNKRCAFCGIELSLESRSTIIKKSPKQLLEVAKAAVKLDNVTHVTLTTGAQLNPSDELHYLATCCSAIKNESGLPIHVQCMPPGNMKLLEVLKKSGADTIGIHIESFDIPVLKKIASYKAELGLDNYISTWEESINIFGKNQVSSFLISGVGEKRKSIIEGATILCELGVYPFIVPLRPIPGTYFADSTPPDISGTISIYQQVASLLKSYGLSWKNSKAGCVRCGACSGLPDYEEI
jgi:radical SAM protein (TIGR04043 family)